MFVVGASWTLGVNQSPLMRLKLMCIAAALEGVGVSVAAVSAVVGGFAGAESVRILTEGVVS